MFVLCPHCQFLVTVDPRSGRPPAACPSCGKPLDGEAKPASETADAPPETPQHVDAPAELPAEPPIEATPVQPEPDPAPQQAQLNADAVIALMAQKPPRKARTEKPAEKPAKRKREPKPAPVPVVKPAAAPKVVRPAGPPLSVRLAFWWASIKPKPRPKVDKPVVETKAKPATDEAKKKATVKPVPSLRERAAQRAAEAQAAEASLAEAPITEAPIIEAPVAEAPVEFIPLAQTPVEAALAVEALQAMAAQQVETTPAPAPEPEPAPAPAPSPIAPEPVAPAPEPARPPVVPQPPALSPAPKPRATINAPSFARTRAGLRGAMPTHWTSLATIGALSLLLVLQLLLAQRDALAENARWRPAMSTLCTVLRCTLPAWRDPEAFTMLSRDVRPHPSAAGTLQIDASFRNDARWAQAWPRLVVNLSDIDGRVLGSRAFTAREYLGDVSGTQTTLGPGQTAAIRLSVVEPAPGVVAFSFEFR